MKKVISIILCMVMAAGVFMTVSAAERARFVGAREGGRYHRSTCRRAKRIPAKDKRIFDSARDARRAGYEPCPTCRPDAHRPPVVAPPVKHPLPPQPPKPDPPIEWKKKPAGESPEWARVVRVIDGDTVRVDDGTEKWNVHLLGINAPEPGETGYREAIWELKKLVLEKRVKLVYDGRKQDRRKNLRAHLYIIQEDTADLKSVEGALILSGWVKVSLKKPGTLTTVFTKIEDRARSKRKGLWNVFVRPKVDKITIRVKPGRGISYCTFKRDGAVEGGHKSGGRRPRVFEEHDTLPREQVREIWDAVKALDTKVFSINETPDDFWKGSVMLYLYEGGKVVGAIAWEFRKEHRNKSVQDLARLLQKYKRGGW